MGAVEALLAEARRAGLTVTPEGTELRVTGPQQAGALVDKLRRHKQAIIAQLRPVPARPVPAAEPPRAPRRIVSIAGMQAEALARFLNAD